ncbi:MAG: chorismate-binding protein [Cyclobacteriaceae bacterium]
MTPKSRITQLRFDQPKDFFQSVAGHQFPVAIWRLPNQPGIQGIADLRPDVHESINIESSQPCFFINPFDRHHPCNPDIIKCDLLLSWNDEVSLELNPMLNDSELEAFERIYHEPTARVKHDSILDQPDYEGCVKKAVEAIKDGQFTKTVLSRFEEAPLPSGFSETDIFEQACEKYPNAMVYLLYSPSYGTWLGATPEILIDIDTKKQFTTVSLAGTQKLSLDQSLSDVAWTQKDIEEQAMVSRYIIDCFKKIRLREFEENGPKTARAGRLAHLKTFYHVDMNAVGMPNLGTVMTDLLHPTSAVCGMPLAPALQFIKENENYDRELYAGFLGPVNIANSTHLFVNLRCMKISGDQARFYAGAGITEDSNPAKELQETSLKMQTLKRLVFDNKD